MQPQAAHRSREHSYLVASRDECCDNGDRLVATHRSHVLGNIYYVGASWQSWCRLLFERAQLAWSRFATGTVTMTTRDSTTSALIYWGTCNSHRRS